MRDKEKARQYNLLYRKKHVVAIRIKSRLYKKLPHVKARTKKQRRKYYQEYYLKHRDEFLRKVREWTQANRSKRRLYCKRYKEKLKNKLHQKSRIERILNEFLEYCRDRYDAVTVRHYQMNIGRFLAYMKERNTRCPEYHNRNYQELKKPSNEQDFSWRKEYKTIQNIEDIDRDYIVRYVSFLNHEEVNRNTGLILSQSEKESRLYPLKTFLLYCLRKGYLKDDLRKYIFVPSREKKVLKRILAIDEMEQLFEAPDTNTTLGIRDRAILELSYSGLRSEEMLMLKFENIDVFTNTVTILDGKGGKDRVVPMTQEAIYWIKRWLNRRHEFIKGGEDPKYLFMTKNALPINRKNLSVLIKKYARKAKIAIDISPHDLRRTTATHLAENGAPLRQIQALLGHTTLRVTTNYIRLSDEKIKEEYQLSHPSNRRYIHYGKAQK
jgi:integrase/recombinase XerD